MDDAQKSLIRQRMQRLVIVAKGGDAPKDPLQSRQKTVEPVLDPEPKAQGKNGKVAISLRLDADVLEILRGSGRGWQTRLNAHLRQAVGLDQSLSDPLGLPPENND